MAGFLLTDQIIEHSLRTVWFTTLAGGIGATVGVCYTLYWHVLVKKDLAAWHVKYYLFYPITGFLLGGVTFFVIEVSFLTLEFLARRLMGYDLSSFGKTLFVLQIAVGWIVGFRNLIVLSKIKQFLQVLPIDWIKSETLIGKNQTSDDPKDDQPGQVTTWGLAILIYASIWVVIFIAGFLSTDRIMNFFDLNGSLPIRAAWFATLAGGIGATMGMFYSPYWHAVIKKDFVPQFLWYYLPRPMIGVIFGIAAYFITLVGFWVIALVMSDFQFDPANATPVAPQIVIAWIAGFRNPLILNKIKRFGQRFAPTK